MLDFSALTARVDETLLAQLTSDDGQAANQARVEAALSDAEQTILGYVEQLREELRPSDDVLVPHQVAICMYLLAGSRAGQEFPALENRYKASIRFLERLVEKNDAAGTQGKDGLGVNHAAPAVRFDDASLDAFDGFGGSL